MRHHLEYGITAKEQQLTVENFPRSGLSPLSLTCTPIGLLSNDGGTRIISTGSGFFWRAASKAFMVTNWHVLSGRNVFSGELLSSTGYIPKEIQIFGVSIQRTGRDVQMVRTAKNLTLSDEFLEAVAQAPSRGFPHDVVAIELPSELLFGKGEVEESAVRGGRYASCFINEVATSDITISVGDDCFILGYPPNHRVGGFMPPLWRHATVASEPLIGVGGLPVFYVDGQTSKAMSGSPIVARMGAEHRLIGVYGGRVTGEEDVPAIGIGWYQSLIPRALEFYGLT